MPWHISRLVIVCTIIMAGISFVPAIAHALTYPISVPVLSVSYLPTIPCGSASSPIPMSQAVATSNKSPMDQSAAPQQAIDGSLTTKWQPAISSYSGTYLQIDLGSSTQVAAIALQFWGADRPRLMHLDGSNSGAFQGEQTRLMTETDGLSGYQQISESPSIQRKDYIFSPVLVRFLRLVIDSANSGPTPNDTGQINLYELSLFSATTQKTCLDQTTTGDVGVLSNPSITDPLSIIRSRITTHTQGIMVALQEGSTCHGYRDPSASPSLTYTLRNHKEFLQPIPISSQFPGRPDYRKILTDLDICNYVDTQGVKDVWIWSYHTNVVAPEESDMAMGRISRSF